MLLRCASCGGGFELTAESLGDRTTVTCPLCGRIVVVREATAVPPPRRDALLDPATEPAMEPLSPAEEPTAIGVARARLSLPPGKRVSVAFLSGQRKGTVVVLEQPVVVFGRAESGADIEAPDPEISRRHAALECHGSRIVLRDMNSRNGTFVGEERLGSRDIEDRTEFRLGSTLFLLVVSDA
jgi:hypothetical protein